MFTPSREESLYVHLAVIETMMTQTPTLHHGPYTCLTPFGSELQAVSTGPASRSAGGMTRHKVTRLHLQERTTNLKGKTIGKFQPSPKNADPSCNLLSTRETSSTCLAVLRRGQN
ncbi:hypothetical protein HID58_034524 [Brassica napus]|uniref:Uncharacterized protein n=1 Tax=Brassica napus TaxID=3708 RepID=A0ABQ8C2F2_BRANA|nr:hypothetical protein HID58_034524 [Brassica napus]